MCYMQLNRITSLRQTINATQWAIDRHTHFLLQSKCTAQKKKALLLFITLSARTTIYLLLLLPAALLYPISIVFTCCCWLRLQRQRKGAIRQISDYPSRRLSNLNLNPKHFRCKLCRPKKNAESSRPRSRAGRVCKRQSLTVHGGA